MSTLTDDEYTVLSLAAKGEWMIPIGYWEKPVKDLALRGLLHANDSVNYSITPAGRVAWSENEDEPYRRILESGTKIANARAQAQQEVEQAAVHLGRAAKASILVTGDSAEHAVASWLDAVKERAVEWVKTNK